MARPDILAEWATEDDFPHDAAPEQDTPTKVEPLAGKKAIGWRPGELPRGAYMNWFMFTVFAWLKWAFTEAHTKILPCSSWVPENGDVSDLNGGDREVPTGGDQLYFPIDFIEVGGQLSSLAVRIRGTTGTETVTMQLYKAINLTDDDDILISDTDFGASAATWDTMLFADIDQDIEADGSYYLLIASDAGGVIMGNTTVSWIPQVLPV